MTQLDPYPLSLDGLVIGDGRYLAQRTRGINSVAPRRGNPVEVGWRHGSWNGDEPYFAEKVLSLEITIFDTDTDLATNHSHGAFGHLEANKQDLFAVLGKRGLIDVRRPLPVDGGGTVELQSFARARNQIDIDEGEAFTWTTIVDLVMAWPFWHELPQISRAAHGLFPIGGTAPVADMVFTFPGAGSVTDNTTGEVLAVSEAAIVDVGAREVTVGGNLKMSALSQPPSDRWMEWPAGSIVDLTGVGTPTVDFYTSHH